MMIWNKRNGEIKALIHPRNWGVQAPQLYSIGMIMIHDCLAPLWVRGVSYLERGKNRKWVCTSIDEILS